MVTVSTPTKPSSTRRSLRSSSAKSGSATPARKARASRKAQAARPSSGSRSAEETSGAETKIAEPATQKATAEPGRVEEPDKAPDNRTGTLVTTVDKLLNLPSHLAWFGVVPLLVVLRGAPPAPLLGYGACFRLVLSCVWAGSHSSLWPPFELFEVGPCISAGVAREVS